MFANECLGELEYEATATSIAMAGAFLAFCLQYVSFRVGDARTRRTDKTEGAIEHQDMHGSDATSTSSQIIRPEDPLNVLTLEAGIIFHSTSPPPLLSSFHRPC